MFAFDDKKFFAGYIKRFGPLKNDLAAALSFILKNIESDTRFTENPTDRYKLAYALATFKWETAHTFRPIDEFGTPDYFEKKYGFSTKIGKSLGNTHAGDGAAFHGRGYVQLTGRDNYKKIGDYFQIDLISHPEKAKDPEIAYKIAIEGMIKGWFTGKKFSDFFKAGSPPNYEDARKIINGLDKAQTIADIARQFDELLFEALEAK